MLAPPDFMYWLHPVPIFFTLLCVVGAIAFHGAGSTRAKQSLQNIYTAIISWPTEEYGDKVQQSRLLAEYDNLSTARQERLSIA